MPGNCIKISGKIKGEQLCNAILFYPRIYIAFSIDIQFVLISSCTDNRNVYHSMPMNRIIANDSTIMCINGISDMVGFAKEILHNETLKLYAYKHIYFRGFFMPIFG